MRRRIAASAIACLVMASALSGCATSVTCVDWPWYETPADAAAEADLVVIGRAIERDGIERMFDVDAHAWSVVVSEWITGESEPTVRVVSTPETCSGAAEYARGDPLDPAESEGEQLLFIHQQGSVLMLVTPWQGAIPAPVDGGMPTEWPAGLLP